jgi:hypothetical protein
MKKLILNLLIIVIAIPVKSQIQFGVKGGGNFSTITGGSQHAAKYTTKIGFNGGVFVNIPVKKEFSLQPELIYSLQGGSAEVQNVDVSGNLLSTGTSKLNLTYIQMPLFAKFTFQHKFYLQTGPQVGLLISAKEKREGKTNDVKSSFQSADLDWEAGLGYTWPIGLGFDLRYNIGLIDIVKNPDEYHNSNLQIDLFYQFGRNKSNNQ